MSSEAFTLIAVDGNRLVWQADEEHEVYGTEAEINRFATDHDGARYDDGLAIALPTGQTLNITGAALNLLSSNL